MVYNRDTLRKELQGGKDFETLQAEMLNMLNEAKQEYDDEQSKSTKVTEKRQKAVAALLDYFEAVAEEDFSEAEANELAEAMESILKAGESKNYTASLKWFL